jgi:hypothetical protein
MKKYVQRTGWRDERATGTARDYQNEAVQKLRLILSQGTRVAFWQCHVERERRLFLRVFARVPQRGTSFRIARINKTKLERYTDTAATAQQCWWTATQTVSEMWTPVRLCRRTGGERVSSFSHIASVDVLVELMSDIPCEGTLFVAQTEFHNLSSLMWCAIARAVVLSTTI